MAMNPRLMRPRETGFNPRRVSNLSMWLDASDSSTITVGTGVSQWKDKSTNASLWAQSTGNNQPATGTQTLNGKNVLVFDGSNDTLTCSAPFNAYPLTLFFVQRLTALTSFGMTYASGSGNDFNLRQDGTSGRIQIQMPSGAATYTSNLFLTTEAQVISIVYDSTIANSVAYLNGTAMTTFSGSFSQPLWSGTHHIGARAGSFFMQGWIAEILVYSKTVSATERASITSYLGKKWGITVA